MSKAWADRADALFADTRASDPGRVLQKYPDLLSPDLLSPDLLSPGLLSLVGLAVIGGFGLFDDGARGCEARHGALEPVLADPALSCAATATADMRALRIRRNWMDASLEQ
ncbi:hypothetical protein ACWTU6_18740 [Mesorhizobium sp. BHbsci]